jgi:hypothetical protein
MPNDPHRDAADHAAKVSALTHVLDLLGAHATGADKHLIMRSVASQIAMLTGGQVRRCQCGRPVVLSLAELRAHDEEQRPVRCARCRRGQRAGEVFAKRQAAAERR